MNRPWQVDIKVSMQLQFAPHRMQGEIVTELIKEMDTSTTELMSGNATQSRKVVITNVGAKVGAMN